MAKVAPKDAYINFATVESALDAADSSVLVEESIQTGLSIRGGLIWVCHLVEFYVPPVSGAFFTVRAALSTRQGLAAIPALGDDGLIAMAILHGIYTVEGASMMLQPHVCHYLPPVPLATSDLSLYCVTDVDVAGLRGDEVRCRMGFTTAPLDGAAYVEIAETWGW